EQHCEQLELLRLEQLQHRRHAVARIDRDSAARALAPHDVAVLAETRRNERSDLQIHGAESRRPPRQRQTPAVAGVFRLRWWSGAAAAAAGEAVALELLLLV